MFKLNRAIDNKAEEIVHPFVAFFHEKLGLTPNQISLISFFFSIIAVGLLLTSHIFAGIIVIIISLVFDKFDGSVAKKYGLISRKGYIIDTVSDRTAEIAIILSLYSLHLVQLEIALLSIIAILTITLTREYAHFDIGCKRWIIVAGYLIGFNLALHIVFFANIAGAAIGLIIQDIKFQQHLDSLPNKEDEAETISAPIADKLDRVFSQFKKRYLKRKNKYKEISTKYKLLFKTISNR